MGYGVIVVNGIIKKYSYYKSILDNAQIILASDGGANLLYEYEQKIDYIVGDMDSIDDDVLQYYLSKGSITKKYPTKKDETDSQIGILTLKDMGIKNIVMIGALGDRVDHFLANINLLYYANSIGVDMKIVDEKNEISLLNASNSEINAKIGQTISFISVVGDVSGITLKGFEYELEKYNLKCGDSILTSNIATIEKPVVSIEKGSLICIKIDD